MFRNIFSTEFLITLPALLICITIHEVSHGLAAYKLGDPTAKNAGRLTLNPLKHIDPIGFIMLWIFRFGWAKPVPVNPMYFKNRKKGMMITSVAGPLSNFLCAIVAAICYVNVIRFNNYIITYFFNMLIVYNAVLCVFNLIPIPPLDGSKILRGLLPYKYQGYLDRIEPYGSIILFALIILNVTSYIITPLVNGVLDIAIAVARHLIIPF